MARILIIDDDEAFRAAFAETLADLGHEPIEAASGRTGLEAMRRAAPDAVFLDYKMAGMDGIEVLRHIASPARGAPPVPVVMLTAFASSSSTIEAMKLGACEHLTKPVARREIDELLARLLSKSAAVERTMAPDDADRMVGNSPQTREVQKLIGRAAAGASSVLITGETGTGKELVARLLHDSSARAGKPFVAVNCAAIPRELLESELFGHVKGAFTGAIADRKGAFRQADGGTLLLDEIGDMGLDMQAKLLRVLEERVVTPVGAARGEPVDLRIVAATHHDLPKLVAEQRFRQDLYFRLNVLPIHIPPLRERPADIADLAAHFLRRVAAPEPMGLSEAAIAWLESYPWPGNARELRNVMERAAALVRGNVVDAADLAFLGQRPASPSAAEFDLALLGGELGPAVEALERTMVRRALQACGGNRAEAARRLGIHRQLLYKKLKQLGID
jgi:two-component system NtrC family response regulator